MHDEDDMGQIDQADVIATAQVADVRWVSDGCQMGVRWVLDGC